MREKITEIFRKIKKDPYMCAGVIITGIILLMILVGIFWMPYEPTKMNASEKLKGISFKYRCVYGNSYRSSYRLLRRSV